MCYRPEKPEYDWVEIAKTTITGIVMVVGLYILLLLGKGFGF